MSLNGLLGFIEQTTEFARLASALKGGRQGEDVVAPEAAIPAAVAAIRKSLGSPVVIITPAPERTRKLAEQVRVWCSGDVPVLTFPEPDALPFERLASDPATSWERLRVLSLILQGASPPPVLIASAAAVASRTLEKQYFASLLQVLRPGSHLDLNMTLPRWVNMGYDAEEQVEIPGTYSRRGGILDVFSPACHTPVRIELFGDNIESLRTFSPETQRSAGPVEEVAVVPAGELVLPGSWDPEAGKHMSESIARFRATLDGGNLKTEARAQIEEELSRLDQEGPFSGADFYSALFNRGCILDYLPSGSVTINENPEGIARALEELDQQCKRLLHDKIEKGELPPNFPSPYFGPEELQPRMAGKGPSLNLWPWEHREGATVLPFTIARSFGGNLETFLQEAVRLRSEGTTMVLVTHQASRVSELLEEKDIQAAPHESLDDAPGPGITIVQGSIPQGWSLKGASTPVPLLTVLSDQEVMGISKEVRLPRNRPVRHQLLRSEIKPGDYVVHIDHGIARFSGMTTMRRDCTDREYLVLEYADSDRIYVPIDALDRVSRYAGAGGAPPTLSRLRSGDWQRAKERVSKSVADIAAELLELHAWREVAKGISFAPDTLWMHELEKSFPYVETPDQLKAVEAVKADMEAGKPMDRLVCGDVGYGKTEVALRSAFKAALDGRQVAILVPTTVLAQQHYATFTERLKPFPVKVAVLSRFCSEREQQDTLKGLAAGSIDICIGTHRLLQKDVEFKDLGLVIIDEEQRFGVTHKERLKKMRREVDILTLSATPIPRTLHMSLAGVRDISLVETPPEERLPIKTYVGQWDNDTVREAILRELKRDGQVLFVHNRVQSLHGVAAEVQTLVPEARVAVAHGQMDEDDLEQVMVDFVGGKKDILLCTTIIESGLDMPRANTLIVKDADRLGLTQLYQLRGRVGRGSQRAYAYFLYGRGKNLTHQAEDRLTTISQASELGAGFQIAMKDLEIRGAGNLLGAEQSGHIAAVGYDLYYRMLEEAVTDLKRRKESTEPGQKTNPIPPSQSFSVELPVCGQLPQEYVPDMGTRIAVYRKLAAVEDEAEIAEIEEDLKDRFGPLPVEAADLLYTAKIRLLAARGGVESLCTEDQRIVLRISDSKLPRLRLLSAIYRGRFEIKGNQIRLDLKRLSGGWRELLPELLVKLGRQS